jgi:DNA segregation ATPase FtsK/SpoIIIE-like protein
MQTMAADAESAIARIITQMGRRCRGHLIVATP